MTLWVLTLTGACACAHGFHGASGGKAAMSEFAAALAKHGFLVFKAEWLARVRPLNATAAIRSWIP